MSYQLLLRPFLFALPPETAHEAALRALRVARNIPVARAIMKGLWHLENPSLKRSLFGLEFPNPVGLAAGFDKNAEVFDMADALGFGFIEVGTITPRPQPGNPRPRCFRLPVDRAIINRMGFNNVGVAAAARRLARRKPGGIIVGGNIGKNSATPNEEAIHDYEELFRELADLVDYIVVNVSCPNIRDLQRLSDRDHLLRLLTRLQELNAGRTTRRPLLLKISPDLTQEAIATIAEVCRMTAIDGIIAANTSISRKGLRTPPGRIAAIGDGGLSGAPLRGRSTALIRTLVEHTGGTIPLIASGGIMSLTDALEKMEAGASLIQLYTGLIYEGPGLVRRINEGIVRWGTQAPLPC